MSKSIVVIETPCDCLDCMFMRRSDDMPGDKPFTYQKLFNCVLEPEHYNDDDERYIDFLNDYIVNRSKPDWCPLKKLPERALANTDVSSINDLRDKSLLAIGWNACLNEIGG